MNPHRPILVILTLALLGGTPAWPAIPLTGVVCGEDVNGDGLVEEAAGELAACVNGLCPVGAVDCGAAYAEAGCPAGGALDPAADVCVLDATVGCPSGYVHDPGIDRCVRAVSCPEAGVLNAATDRCEKLPINECPAGWSYDSVQDVCTKTAECSAGTVLNPARDRCETAYAPGCPADYVHDLTQDRCESAPVCAQGAYTPVYDLCLEAYTVGCPAEYAYDAGRDRCERAPECPTGFAYGGTRDACLATIPSCPPGYGYHAGRDRCERTPSCPVGTAYNAATNRCEGTATALCTVSTPAVSLSGSGEVPEFNRVEGNGTRLEFFGCSEYQWFSDSVTCTQRGVVASITVNGATLSGGGEVPEFDRIEGAGNRLDYYGCTEYQWSGESPTCVDRGVVASVAVSGATVSGGGAVPQFSRVGGTGNRLDFHGCTEYCLQGEDLRCCENGVAASLTFSGIPIRDCPLAGGSSCTGNPPQCSAPVVATASCPDWVLDRANDVCQAPAWVPEHAAACPSGTLDVDLDLCFTGYGKTCPVGMVLDPGSDQCTLAPTCLDGGLFDPTEDVCALAPTPDCGLFAYDPATDVCISDPVCAPGVYDAPSDACWVAVAKDCGSYAWDGAAGTCVQPVSCPTDPAFPLSATIVYSSALDRCVSEAEHACLAGYGYQGLPRARCEAVPACPTGHYDAGENRCYQGDEDCPLGNYPCADLGAGRNQCSPNPCVDLAVTPPEDIGADLTSYRDDGTVDSATGECSGFFLVFNGNASECLPPGYGTTWFDCCDADADNFLFVEENCGEKSVETVQARIAERAVRVGAYCKKKIKFVGCIQKADSYCLFSSKLARMIHEQGRAQLEAFGPEGGWGAAEDPNCVGFTPEEFQALDFGEIDFGEFFGDIATPSTDAIQDGMQRKIVDHFDEL